MTEAQQVWMRNNPDYTRVGPPRPVRFTQWGTLHADGTYERMDNQPRKPIQVGTGSIGVCIIAQENASSN